MSLMVIAHYSSLLHNLISGEKLEIENNMILPVYPCNVFMWLGFITALIRNKKSKLFLTLAEFVFLGGTVCGSIGIFFNVNFLNNPTFHDFDIVKGLISHLIMVLGCLYLFVMNYVKINVISNLKSCFVGLCILVICGLYVNLVYYALELEPINAMFMQKPPFENLPYFNFFVMGIIGLFLVLLFTLSYELIFYKKEERSFYSLFKTKQKVKSNEGSVY